MKIWCTSVKEFDVHICWFSPKILIQEIIVFTDVGFHLNSGFTKILCTPIFPLHTAQYCLQSKPKAHWTENV